MADLEGAAAPEGTGDGQSKNHTADNQSYKAHKEKFVVAEFFAHWCPASRNYKPHYEKVAKLFNGPDAAHPGRHNDMDDKGNDGEILGDTCKDDKDMGDRGNGGYGMDDKDNDFVAMEPKGMDGMRTDDNDEDACKDGIDIDDVHLPGKTLGKVVRPKG
ncbi:hypothetical protein ZWY2020_049368 [Hordeum vulgare]|nr:hypothetical protein ZWY2020_049368 [Hordeum vulgare]